MSLRPRLQFGTLLLLTITAVIAVGLGVYTYPSHHRAFVIRIYKDQKVVV